MPQCVHADSALHAGARVDAQRLLAGTHGCIGNFDCEAWQPPIQDLPVAPELMRASGYRTAYVGKGHVDKEKDPTHYGYEKYVSPSGYGPWRAAQGLKPAFQWKDAPLEKFFGLTDAEARPEHRRWPGGRTARWSASRNFGTPVTTIVPGRQALRATAVATELANRRLGLGEVAAGGRALFRRSHLARRAGRTPPRVAGRA